MQHMCRVYDSYTGPFCLHDTDFESIGVLVTIGICQSHLVKLRVNSGTSKLSGPVGVELIASPASDVINADSKSLVDGVSSSALHEERLTRPSLASSNFAIVRLRTAASFTVDLRAEHCVSVAAERGPEADSCLRFSSRGAACSLRCSKCSPGSADAILCRSCIACYLAHCEPEHPTIVVILDCIFYFMFILILYILFVSSSSSNSSSVQFTSRRLSCSEPELCKACKLKVCRKCCAIPNEAEALQCIYAQQWMTKRSTTDRSTC